MAKKASTSRIGVDLRAPTKVMDLVAFGQMVHDKMAANTVLLPAPSPALPTLQTSVDTLKAKEANAKARLPGAVNDRNVALKALKVDLNSERLYVEGLCNQHPDQATQIAEAAGMSLHASGARSKPPLAAKAGTTSGVVHLVAVHAKGAKANEWQYSTDAGKTWVQLPSTTAAKTTVANLPPGTTVQFRQRAVTKDGVTEWSLPLPHVVA